MQYEYEEKWAQNPWLALFELTNQNILM